MKKNIIPSLRALAKQSTFTYVRKMDCRVAALLAMTLVVPITANATITSDKMTSACAADNVGCEYYTLGGAERFWLVTSPHEKCDAAADKKVIDQVTAAAKAKPSLYVTEKPAPAAVPLLQYLNKNKLQSCSLATRYSDMVGKCASTDATDQTVCHAYVAGVVDMALAMDEIHQLNVAKGEKVAFKSPFCEKGAEKKKMTDDEVMKTLGDWSKANAKDTASTPAAAGIIDALLEKYNCKPTATEKPAAKTTASKKKK
ncbi:MAG: Rap1a/Tai family immunity protein [Rickettsiales bacterium]